MNATFLTFGAYSRSVTNPSVNRTGKEVSTRRTGLYTLSFIFAFGDAPDQEFPRGKK